jgi:hypothetical protein
VNRISALEPAEPIQRYERQHPGELIHLDIKKLGRIGSVGHRITGRSAGVVKPSPRHRLGVRPRLDRRRLAHRVRPSMPDQRKQSAVAFLEAAYFAKLGVRLQRVMTDNG